MVGSRSAVCNPPSHAVRVMPEQVESSVIRPRAIRDQMFLAGVAFGGGAGVVQDDVLVPEGVEGLWGFGQGYAYAVTGQVTQISDLIVATVRTYAYADPSHPNAVTAVTDGTSTDSFTYDMAGRMVTRSVDGVVTSLVWDVSSNLVATTGQGGDIVYVYDGAGQRVAQVSVGDLAAPTPVRATVYVGATEVTDPNTAATFTGDVQVSRYYTHGGATVAMATTTSTGGLSWQLLLSDMQGSVSVAMELVADSAVSTGFASATATDTVTGDAFLPYGGARGGGEITTDRGWLGQYEDAGTGLTYLNARYYDPVLGRFLSPDPLLNPGDPRTLDPYRYADNNPIMYTDPSGLAPSVLCVGYTGMARSACNTSIERKRAQVQAAHDQQFARQNAALNRQYDPVPLVAIKGYANFWWGASNGVIDVVNGASSAVSLSPVAQAAGFHAPQIPTIGIWGDYSTYRYSSYAGSITIQAAALVATSGGSAAADGTTIAAKGVAVATKTAAGTTATAAETTATAAGARTATALATKADDIAAVAYSSSTIWSVDALSATGTRVVSNDLTRAGQELAKHSGQGGFPVPTGSPRTISRIGQTQLDDVLTFPGTRVSNIQMGNFAGGRYYIAPDGRGAAFDSSGVFQYFGVFE